MGKIKPIWFLDFTDETYALLTSIKDDESLNKNGIIFF